MIVVASATFGVGVLALILIVAFGEWTIETGVPPSPSDEDLRVLAVERFRELEALRELLLAYPNQLFLEDAQIAAHPEIGVGHSFLKLADVWRVWDGNAWEGGEVVRLPTILERIDLPADRYERMIESMGAIGATSVRKRIFEGVVTIQITTWSAGRYGRAGLAWCGQRPHNLVAGFSRGDWSGDAFMPLDIGRWYVNRAR